MILARVLGAAWRAALLETTHEATRVEREARILRARAALSAVTSA